MASIKRRVDRAESKLAAGRFSEGRIPLMWADGKPSGPVARQVIAAREAAGLSLTGDNQLDEKFLLWRADRQAWEDEYEGTFEI